jgi:ATP-dependent exoDNAse (exonuclease V) beta subunit
MITPKPTEKYRAMNRPTDFAERSKTPDLTAHLIMQAPAGSGKTSELTKRFLACLAVSDEPEEVMAITFTNKATAEMQERIVSALRRSSSDELPESDYEQELWHLGRKVLARDSAYGWNLLINISRLRILTFDKLSAYLATQLPVLSGIGGGLQIEENASILYREAVLGLFNEYEEDSLDPVLHAALEHLLRFAGNRVDRLIPMLSALLERRDHWIDVLREQDSMGMSHSLRDFVGHALNRSYVSLGTAFKRDIVAALRQASCNTPLEWAHDLDEWPAPDVDNLSVWRQLAEFLLTKDGALIKRVTVTNGFPAGKAETVLMKELLADLHDNGVAHIESSLRHVLALPEPSYPSEMDEFRSALSVALIRLVAHLKLVFAEKGRVDFTEVSQRALEALANDDSVTDVLQRLDYTIRHILVDEVQDTSVSQIRLLRRLTSGWALGEGRSLFMVGDPMQSIYMFRQAEVRLFLDVLEHQGLSEHLPMERACLTTNFRSTRVMVDWFNRAFLQIFPAEANLYTSAVPFSPSSSMDHSADGGVVVHPLIGADEENEAAKVVEVVRTSLEKDPSGSVAILVRERSHVVGIVRAFKDAGIPYSAQDIDPISMTGPVQDILNLISALHQPLDKLAWFNVLRAPFVGVGWHDTPIISRFIGQSAVDDGLRSLVNEAPDVLTKDSLFRIRRLVGALDDVMSTPALAGDLPSAVEAVWRAMGGPHCLTSAQRQDIRSLLSTLAMYCEAGQLRDLRAFKIAAGRLFATPEAGQVQIMTMHKSKGLEFDTVILPGLGRAQRHNDAPLFYQQAFPTGFVVAPAPRREDRHKETPGKRLYDAMRRLQQEAFSNETARLLYVAITRARTHLHLLGHVPRPREGSDMLSPASGSLLSVLWPVVAADFAAEWRGGEASVICSGEANTNYFRCPVVRRVPLDFSVTPPAPVFEPAYNPVIVPSALASGATHDTHAYRNQRQAEGEVFHQVMEAVANSYDTGWNAGRVNELRPSIRARLLSAGVGLRLVEESCDFVVQLAINTLGCPSGRWLLQSHDWAKSEYAIGGRLNGQWVSAIIDRAIEVDGVLWIIDYKTSGANIAANDVPEFLESEAERYRHQIEHYVAILGAMRGTATIRGALYFPALQKLKQLSDHHISCHENELILVPSK